MTMNNRRRCAASVLAVLALAALVAPAGASAQGSDGWSFVVTPQVWLSHIAKNGFAAAPDTAIVGGVFVLDAKGNFATNAFPSEQSPRDTINPQWGLQLGAQKGRLTLAGAFQYVEFTTHNDITFNSPQNQPLCLSEVFGVPGLPCSESGQRWAKELVDTTRLDIDVAASYFFPALLGDRIDASVGAGFKFIYASAERRYSQHSPAADFLDNSPLLQPPGLYTICRESPCGNDTVTFKRRVREKSYLYGVTFPLNATTHLTRDGRWLLPFSIAPLIGAEYRDDRDVVYRFNLPSAPTQLQGPPEVKRLDGTTFAYGVTADLSLRWIITETLSAYAGMRVQYIKGHDTYLAYGPLLGMSFRFGAL